MLKELLYRFRAWRNRHKPAGRTWYPWNQPGHPLGDRPGSSFDQVGKPANIDGRTGQVVDATDHWILIEWDA